MESPLHEWFSLEGKVALVTGCNRGIGLAIAEGLAQAGADIIGVSRSLPSKGSEAEEKVLAHGRQFYPYTCDFSQRDELFSFLKEIEARHPAIDILINNAGTIKRAPIAEHPTEYWDTVIETNLSSPFILAREIGKNMVKAGSGKIIFIASLLSYQGGILVPGYAASKGGIQSLIKAFANEWAGKGVNVNGIVPGYIATDNTEALRNDPERSQSILSRIPAGRWGRPQDLAGAAVFLASPAANYIHGSMVTVDGGWMGR